MPTPVIVIIIVAIFSWGVWLALPLLLRWRGVSMRKTRFGLALIFDSADEDATPVRLLNVNGVYQSVCYVPQELRWELCCVYHRNMAEAIAQTPAASRLLVLGGGGCSLPKYLAAHEPRLSVDVVEIDPAIIDIAREFFYLDECLAETPGGRAGHLHVREGDAWAWLRNSETPYDVVVNDAFAASRPLGPLATDEGARLVHERLAPGGLYLANVRSALEGRKAAPLEDVLDAFSAEFLHVAYVPDSPERPRTLGYNTLLASDATLPRIEGAITVR